jgi:hypothetical protein
MIVAQGADKGNRAGHDLGVTSNSDAAPRDEVFNLALNHDTSRV